MFSANQRFILPHDDSSQNDTFFFNLKNVGGILNFLKKVYLKISFFHMCKFYSFNYFNSSI